MGSTPLVAVFTPTFRYGGLDVNYASLQRQTHKNWLWIVGDDLYPERQKIFREEAPISNIVHFQPPQRRTGFHRNLAAAYNAAMNIARYHNADIFVSMQDYIWAQDDGLERFIDVIEENNCMVTGLTSLTFDPDPATAVFDKEGLWTIFKEPYKTTDKPSTIAWSDVRANMHPWGQIDFCNHEHFESNWAAWPLYLTKGIEFDEKFDEHVAFENQDFALQCQTDNNVPLMIDPMNHALGLPHKKYFPKDEFIDGPHCKYNRELLQKKWGV